MAKRSETTRAMQLCLRGNFKVTVSLRNCIANSCISRRRIWRSAAINESAPQSFMNFKLKIWRQRNAKSRGKIVKYEVRDISPDTSFLEMLDILNENLLRAGEEPVAFDSDCREGICGTCSLTVNGEAHGPDHPGAVCELYMRKFRDGEFPIVKDLVVDRSALDRIVQAGGFISARAGSAPEANSILVPKHDADLAMEAAACIGCGACAAACPNGSAMLFTAAKVSHLSFLPQGAPERARRALKMVQVMDAEGFGNC